MNVNIRYNELALLNNVLNYGRLSSLQTGSLFEWSATGEQIEVKTEMKSLFAVCLRWR